MILAGLRRRRDLSDGSRLWRLAAAGLLCSTSWVYAETRNYAKLGAVAGVQIQVNYHATGKKDCAPAPLPTIRVIEAPSAGTLMVRKAELTTDQIAGCPKLKIPAQVVFYLARVTSRGPDHFVYETTDVNGDVQIFDYTVNVKEAPPKARPSSNTRQPI